MAGVVVCNPPGNKLGNSAMSWLHAYAHAKRVGAEFQCPPWIGERVFHLPVYQRPQGDALPVRSEIDLRPDETDVEIRGYAQNQAAMIYTKRQAQEWLKLRHDPAEILAGWGWAGAPDVAAHLRRGDYVGYGYPLVSVDSYHKAVVDHKLGKWDDRGCLGTNGKGGFMFTSEEHAWIDPKLGTNLSWLPDFLMLQSAPVLLRANSSFSWVAGLLSKGRVFAPIVKGLQGGIEHDVEFVEGNWPALSDLACGSDMHLPE